MGRPAALPEPPRPVGPGGLVSRSSASSSSLCWPPPCWPARPPAACAPTPSVPSQAASDTEPGSIAYVTMEQFSATVGPRPSEQLGRRSTRPRVRPPRLPAVRLRAVLPGVHRRRRRREGAVRPTSSPSSRVSPARRSSSARTTTRGRGPPAPATTPRASASLIEMAARLADDADAVHDRLRRLRRRGGRACYGSLHYLEALDETSRGALSGHDQPRRRRRRRRALRLRRRGRGLVAARGHPRRRRRARRGARDRRGPAGHAAGLARRGLRGRRRSHPVRRATGSRPPGFITADGRPERRARPPSGP